MQHLCPGHEGLGLRRLLFARWLFRCASDTQGTLKCHMSLGCMSRRKVPGEESCKKMLIPSQTNHSSRPCCRCLVLLLKKLPLCSGILHNPYPSAMGPVGLIPKVPKPPSPSKPFQDSSFPLLLSELRFGALAEKAPASARPLLLAADRKLRGGAGVGGGVGLTFGSFCPVWAGTIWESGNFLSCSWRDWECR